MNKSVKLAIIVGAIVLVILLIIISYFYFTRRQFTCLLKPKTHLVDNYNTFVSNAKLPLSKQGHNYALALHLYIVNNAENSQHYSNVNYDKPIIFRYGSPNISYNLKKHQLKIEVSYKDDKNRVTNYPILVDDLPLQKWCHLIVSVNNTDIAIYLDGVRIIGGKLPNVPFVINKNIYIGEKKNNFNGYIANARYYNTSINTNAEATNIFNQSSL